MPDLTHFLEAKQNHLTGISIKNAALKETNSQTSVTVQRNVLPDDYLEKLTRDTQQLTLEREKRY